MARDGNRTSDPLIDLGTGPGRSPDFQINRHVLTDDAAAVLGALPPGIDGGVNFSGYNLATLHVVPRDDVAKDSDPGGSSTLTIAVFDFCKAMGVFIQDASFSVTHPGAGQAFAVPLDVRGRRLFFHVAGVTPGQSVSLYTSGHLTDLG